MTKEGPIPSLIPSERYAHSRVVLTGTTGFLGKVVLAMLLERYPTIERIYPLIRPGASDKARERFDKTVATSPALEPLRQQHGDGFADFLNQKVQPVDGNITRDDCGLSSETLALFQSEGVDLIINSAGLVDFDPPIDQALAINARGAQNVVELAQRLDAAVVHVSTAFVAGARSGQVLESEPIIDRVPPGFETRGEVFDHEREIELVGRLATEVRSRIDDPALVAQWHEEAREKLSNDGRDPDNPSTMRAGVVRQKKIWLADELRRVGMERARFWGWTNTYTFTKALGEMVIAKAVEQGLRASIVRPSIVESALQFPSPGWNEGFTTTAPLILMIRRGILHFPFAEDLILDVIPCDMVSAVIVGAGAACIEGSQRLVYQAATGDQNPLTIRQAIELTAWHAREHARESQGRGLVEYWKRNNETQPISADGFRRFSIPRFRDVAERVIEGLDRVGVDRLVWARQPASAIHDFAVEVKKSGDQIDKVLDLFLPFVAENRYVFRTEHSRELMQRMPDDERLGYDPRGFRWRDYYLDVHVPGLERWVFPRLEEELADKPKALYMYRDLGELFEATCTAHRHRVAFELLRNDGKREQLTYGEMHRLSRRVAAFLEDHGAKPETRIGLMGENLPEWGPCYFGILRAGCTVVPIDAGSSPEEVGNLLEAADAVGLIVTPEVRGRIADDTSSGSTEIWPMEEVLCYRREKLSPESPASVASLIFTSGTTGTPKGVMLSHRNFTFEVSRLAGVFELDEDDHLLSVLPLHHTFEFTAGFLLPLSRGARITYLETLDSDSLNRALASGVSGLIGVPALWQLLQRRIESRLGEGALAKLVLEGVKQTNLFLRDRLGLNVGTFAAFPIHRALGGRLKYLVSGGSALDPEVMTFFRGLGFNMTEGYGLTETAPVLTVTDPSEKVIAGSVGRPIAGVQIDIDGADENGVGEVLARGPNVMVGYLNDPETTATVFRDGWLRTGDLGRLDDEGRLYIVGREKDVIVDGDGRNVYPDEIEEAYGKHPAIDELSVVGVVQGGGERVACLLVPDYGEREPGVVRDEIREHVRAVSEGLPFHKRIKILEIWDGSLPRTAKRSVKRSEVVTILERLVAAGRVIEEMASGSDHWMAVRDIVAKLTGRTPESLTPELRVHSDLAFDSLTFMELSAQLERLAGSPIANEELLASETLDDITKLVAKGGDTPKRKLAKVEPRVSKDDDATLVLPRGLQTLGRRFLSWGQRAFYDRVMDCDIRGANCVPKDTTFLVAANHASHLDAGLLKTALGEYGKNLVALAARDYFWGSPIVRTYTVNFTSLVPIERHGAVKQSMRRALQVLERGDSLLLFPEGTRSGDGRMQEFKSSVGYLAIASSKPVLPAYVWGTFEAMPKGSTLLPKERSIGVAFGPAIRPDLLTELIAGRARGESHRMVTRLVEAAVHALRDSGTYRLSELVAQVESEFPRRLPPEASAVNGEANKTDDVRGARRRAGLVKKSRARTRQVPGRARRPKGDGDVR
ncbi:MAG: AMP-binding protein [Myxococcota bacterium]